MSERDGGPAFPLHVSWMNERKGYMESETHEGMSLRDYFAATALPHAMAHSGYHYDGVAASIAKLAYTVADAMLAERARSGEAGEATQNELRG